MFTPGRKIFAICFIIVFLIVIAYLFYQDRKDNKELFKGTYWVLIVIMGVILTYLIVNHLLH